MMKRLFWIAAFVALLVGAYYQETGGNVESLPAGVRPFISSIQNVCERCCGCVRSKVISLAGGVVNRQSGPKAKAPDARAASASRPGVARQPFASNTQASGSGTVIKILSDDRMGGRHQRFIIRLASGQTLLIAHNIDVAPRIASLRKGDTVSFCGEYKNNAQGGMVHWTHRDPSGRHAAGWLKHNGKTYQ